MKNVKNMNDIAAIATAKVNELIKNGFVFNFGTMAGSQGDDFKADLTKDGITYRVRVFHEFRYDGFDDAEILEVRKYEQNFADDSFASLWNKDGEVVESHVWYRMRNRNGYVYTDDVEAFEAAQELSYARRINSRDDDTKSAIAPEKVIEKVALTVATSVPRSRTSSVLSARITSTLARSPMLSSSRTVSRRLQTSSSN